MSNKKIGRPGLVSITDKDRLLSDHKRAKNLAELAGWWGISTRTAAKYLKMFGVELKSGRRKGDFNCGEYHPKLGVWRDSRIANELGVSEQAVSAARRTRGIESPTSRAFRIMEGE